jgi:hypothetical protein
MRAALVMVLLVGCSQESQAPVAIDVIASPTRVTFYVSPGDSCTCHGIETFPTAASCTQASDAGPACTCYPGACLTHVSLLRAGTVIGGSDAGPTVVQGIIPGDFTQTDLALRFEGCGDDATIPLTSQFPEPVTYSTSSDGVQVSWPMVANSGFLVRTTNPYYGELCRTAPDATSQQLDLSYEELEVHTLQGPVPTSSGSISFQLWSSN